MLRLLIVDDEYAEREGLRFLIENAKLPLVISDAENGEKALALMEKEAFDILLTDIRMPFIDGLELAMKARTLYPHLSILFYTAYGEFDYALRAIQIQVSGYILKPVKRETLIAEILRVIEEKTAHKQSLRESVENHLIALMRGVKNPEALARTFTSMGVKTDISWAMYIVEMKGLFFADRYDAFDDLCEQWHRACCRWMLDARQAAVLLTHFEGSQCEAEKLGMRLRDMMYEAFAEAPAVLFKVSARGLYTLRETYHQLDELAEMRMLVPGRVYNASELAAMNDPKAIVGVQSALAAASEALAQGDLRSAYVNGCDFVAKLDRFHNASSVYVKYLCMQLAQALNRAVVAGSDPHLADAIFKARGVEELSDLMNDMLLAIKPDAEDENDRTIDSIREYIHRHYDGELSLDELASNAYLSPTYLSFLFKKKTGVSLIKYITAYRIEIAQTLLLDGALRISDIAGRVGYDSPSYFSAVFRAHVGMTPAQFRRKAVDEDA